MRPLTLAALCALLAAPSPAQQDSSWPQFRGPNGTGVGSAAGYPVQFSPAANVAWKAAIPYGQSSPVVVDGRVYITGSDAGERVTLCLDAATGRELWRRNISVKTSTAIYRANDPASPTPAADRHGVVVFFPDFGLAAFSPAGEPRWTLPLGPFSNFYGMAGSPILAGETLILVCDQLAGSFLLGVDRHTGRQLWKTPRPGAGIGWATPVIFRPPGGPDQLIVLGSTRLDAYYPATGEPIWWTPVGSMGSFGVPVALGSTLLVSTRGATEPYLPPFETPLAKYDKDKDGRLSTSEFSGDPDLGGHFGWIDINSDNFITATEWNETRNLGIGEFGTIALRPGSATGQIPPAAILWRFKRNLPYIPAPLLYQDVLYLVRDGGIITSLNPASGQILRQGRSPNALGEYYASPVAADGKVFLASTEGKITVLKAAPEWEILAVNDLDEQVHATPALSDGRIFIRTRSSLYCFGAPSLPAAARR